MLSGYEGKVNKRGNMKTNCDSLRLALRRFQCANVHSELRYRVVAVNGDAAQLLSGPCPCYWLDRATNKPLTYKDGSEARWATLDEAIDAFIEGKLTVECNEVLQ